MSRPDPTRNERQRRWAHNHPEQVKAKRERDYYGRKAAGLCVVCGQRPAVAGLVRCEECRAKHKDRKALAH